MTRRDHNSVPVRYIVLKALREIAHIKVFSFSI